MLFSQLFGESDPDDDVSPETTTTVAETGNSAEKPDAATNGQSQNGGSVDEGKSETNTRISTRQFAQMNEYEPKKLFNKVIFEYNILDIYLIFCILAFL